MAMRPSIVTKQPYRVLSTVVSLLRESLEEVETAGCIRCFILVVADAPNVYRKHYHHLTCKPAQYCRQTRFIPRATPISRLVPPRLPVKIGSCIVYDGRML